MAQTNLNSFCVAVFAPGGQDGVLMQGLLDRAGLVPVIYEDALDFDAALGETTGFAVLTDEHVAHEDLQRIERWILAQPGWSDLPFVVLTRAGHGPECHPSSAMLQRKLRNVTFIERPFHASTFISVAITAMRARLRQYQQRANLEQLRVLNDSLEERVHLRTFELEQINRTMETEIELRRQTEALLRQSQKMEVLGQLTGGVAHDFNNLLMVLSSNLELLERRIDDPAQRRLLKNAMGASIRGATLTQRLLAFSRKQELDVRPGDLVGLLRGMSDLIVRAVGNGICVEFNLPPDLPPVLMDINQIELAVLNLAVNARDAMPVGGVLTISADVVEVDMDENLKSGRYGRVLVCDQGSGMDELTLSRARDPFFSTKESGKGTGLGLSMVHRLVLQLEGHLRLSSEPGRGTQAEILLPVSGKTTLESEAPAAVSGFDLENSIKATVLLVDDDPLILESTACLLEDIGHEVIVASSGEVAIATLVQGISVDIVISDYLMPGMNGLQLADEIRKRRLNVPFLLTSGFIELEEGEEGSVPRLNKPYQRLQLAQAIAALVGRAA